jgi:excisionase family DNA binding protein
MNTNSPQNKSAAPGYARPKILDGLVSQDEIANELGVHPRTIERWVRQGDFPKPFVLGRKRYWEAKAVRALLESNLGGPKG